MAQFKAFSPHAEVMGGVVMSVINAMGAFQGLARRILGQHGMADTQEQKWYPMQSWLDALKMIAEEIGPTTLFHVGTQIPSRADIDPSINTIEKALTALDEAYRSAHRGGDVGSLRFSRTSGRSGVVEAKTPYPCDFDRGVIHSLARRFEPSNAVLDVRHDDYMPCKKQGGEYCTYSVIW